MIYSNFVASYSSTKLVKTRKRAMPCNTMSQGNSRGISYIDVNMAVRCENGNKNCQIITLTRINEDILSKCFYLFGNKT